MARRTRSTPIVPLLAAVLLLMPAAGAQLYDRASDPYFGIVHEPDDGVVYAPYNGLHDLSQHASDLSGGGGNANGLPPGWGDGSLVIDSQFYLSAAGATLLGHYGMLDELRGGGPYMYPGHGQFFAWFGTWNDLDNDGRIDDRHDFSDSGPDEFLWRGAATGETFSMPIWIIPYSADINLYGPANRVHVPGSTTGAPSPPSTTARASLRTATSSTRRGRTTSSRIGSRPRRAATSARPGSTKASS